MLRPCNRVIWLGVMSLFLLGATGCNERLKRMESNQVVLEEKIDHNSRQVLMLARKMERSQGALEVRINRVQEGSNVALAETRATRYEQEKLREETRQFGQKWYAGIMRVEEHQRLLQNSVNGVAGTATEIDEGVQKLDSGQEAAREVMAANQSQTQASFSEVRSGQNDLKHAATEAVSDLKRGQDGIKDVAAEGVAAAGRVSDQVTDLQKSQDAQTGVIRTQHKSLVAKVDDVAADQRRFQRTTSQQARRLSQQVTSGHADLKKASTLQSDMMAERANTLETGLKTSQKNQEDLLAQLKGHHEYAVDMGAHVTAMEAEQKRMNHVMEQGNRTVDSAVKAVGKNQEKLERTLKNVESTTEATHKQAGTIADKQSEFHTLQEQRHSQVIQAVSDLESSQDKTQDTVVRIEKDAQAIVRETGTIRDQQLQSDRELKKEGADIHQALAAVEKSQDQIHRSVNNVQVTTNTVASNTTTLMEQQAALQRVTHKNQAQLVESLDKIEAEQKAASKDAKELKQGQVSFKKDMHSGHAGISQDVDQVNASQTSLNEMMRSGKEDLDAQLDAVNENQAGLRNRLADQKGVSQDMAKQIKVMQADQARISQSMDQKQQAWEDQTEDLAERVAALEKSLGHVDENVSSLQTNLVSQITELTKVMKVLQEQGGAQIAQLTTDMKAFNGALKQIQATQSTLARRIDEVGASQSQQGKAFLTALERLQKQAKGVSSVEPGEVECKEVDVVK